MKTIHELRDKGRTFCQTEGSEHYKGFTEVEPMDLIISQGFVRDFCLANIIKYAARYSMTQNLKDLRKISDYSHILCGYEMEIREECEVNPSE